MTAHAQTISTDADAKLDRRILVFDGKSPDKLACDTTLRQMPDGSWVMVMLGGGDFEPLPANQIFLTRSRDEGKTWGPLQPLDLGFSRQGDSSALCPSELMIHGSTCTLFVSTHDGTVAAWKQWLVVSEDSGRTWGKPVPAPGRLHERTFIRNHIVTRDGRILLPFQHYLRMLPPKPVFNGFGQVQVSAPIDPRNGILMSEDGGKTWTEHGDIRITDRDDYHGWAENNIVELADGRIAMIIRADGLGGVLYYAESTDGGRTWPAFARKSDIPNPGSKATLYGLGGDTVALLHNPNPKHRSPLALWISYDGMKSWPYRRVLVAESTDGPQGWLNYPDGFVSADRRYLHFAYDDSRHRAVYYGAALPAAAPLPRVNFAPGPEYADANRCFGIASSIARSPGGRLWCGFTSGGNGEGQLNYGIVVRSDDDGAIWTPPAIVFDAHDEGLIRSDHVTVWTAPTGALWILWSRYPTDLNGPGSSLWCIMSDNPDAAEPRWSAPRKLADGQNLLTTPTVLADGTWIFPTGCWNRAASLSRPLISRDQGVTFELGGPLHAAQDPDFDEYMIVERADQRLVIFNRHTDSFLQCESADGGRSWTRQEPNGIRHTNSRFVFMKLASGNWLLVKQGRLDWISDAQEERTTQRGRSHLTAYLSDNEGKTWKGGLLLDERECSYPFGCQAADGTIYVSYERNRWRQPEILFARFTEADVLAGKTVSSRAALRGLVNKGTAECPR